ncbi:exonuclease VIII [Caballeronia temeraria]|uniref:Exonuclease VIII n=1 Tax=Caballeronia temeraria TaxID=1777137 RepID=A0A158AXF1_9BURK|nr:PD-(D/E)XK nuclease-like domain-containing protein [Caballeronia temeraria]SAK62492.1 exonuclease VIII [Caballeronia temeraria]
MIRSDLTIEQYHALPDVSKSGLDDLHVSPAHFFALHRDPNRPAPRERAGQLEGNLAHCAILEPDEFAQRYVTIPNDAPRRPTDAQWHAAKPSEASIRAMAWWREFNERTQGVTVISPGQYDAAMRQAESVRALPDIREALSRGRAEVSAFWRDPETGVACRCRPDWIYEATDAAAILVDVKTFSSAGASEFARQAARKRYHVQDAFYTDGYAAASGRDVLAFIFVAVETEWPYAAHAMMLDDPSKAQGRAEYQRNLRTYARCVETGEWPGYSKEISLITLPSWAFQD